jgi:2-polyprenyl-6-methoxyphenol hydroxylase-like FAD-dependent oxidoreductase
MPDQPDFDVVIVGYGPTGALLAILLAQQGHRVGVFERWPDIYGLPRAVHFDDEVGRIFQAAGVRREVLAITDPVPDFYEWRNRDGEVLLKIDWATPGAQGWPTANFFSQPALQRVLHRRVRELPAVSLYTGWEVNAAVQSDDHVTVEAQEGSVGRRGHWSGTGASRSFTSHYLVGADGANSSIRQIMGADFHDLGFLPFDWLILDVIPHDSEREWSPMNWQLCDPRRPTTIVSGGPNRRRWEFMRLPGEEIEDLNTTATAWRLLEPWGIAPQTATLERHAVYRFMARYAQHWRAGRMLLTGDAAHLMPPFAGQGMCNGLRDAMNLAWKLDLVLTGRASDELLDSYQRERLDHARQWIEFSAALGGVICVLDEAEAAERDARMLAGGADPARVLPAAPPQRLGEGLFVTEQPAAGTHFVQGSVRRGGESGLFDDVVGHGFSLIGYEHDPWSPLDEAGRAFLQELGARILHIAPGADGGAVERVTDLDGVYASWFAAHACTVALVRPDFHVFGVAQDDAGVRELVARLRRSIGTAGEPIHSPDPAALSGGHPRQCSPEVRP